MSDVQGTWSKLIFTVIQRIRHYQCYFFFHVFYYLLAVLGLRCCVRSFSSCGERGLLFVVVRGLLIAGASLVAEHGL